MQVTSNRFPSKVVKVIKTSCCHIFQQQPGSATLASKFAVDNMNNYRIPLQIFCQSNNWECVPVTPPYLVSLSVDSQDSYLKYVRRYPSMFRSWRCMGPHVDLRLLVGWSCCVMPILPMLHEPAIGGDQMVDSEWNWSWIVATIPSPTSANVMFSVFLAARYLRSGHKRCCQAQWHTGA